MHKRILSISILTVWMAGITIYGYQYQLHTAFASVSTETSFVPENAGLSEADTKALPEDNEFADHSVEQARTASDTDGSSIAKETDTISEQDAADESGTDTDAESDDVPSAEDAEAPTVDMDKVTMFPEPTTMYVQTSVNVRSGPDTSFDKIGFIKTNDELMILGQYENDGWYYFLYHGEDAFVSNLYIADTMVELPDAAPDSAAADPAQQIPEPQTEASPAPQPAPEPVAAAGVLFIGDSRCVQMKEAVGGGGCSWICENSKGYNWLIETALSRADNLVGKGTKVVMCLGVNDTRNCNNYAAIMNQKAAEWAARGAKTYYVSVNPVWENPYTSEEQVENFNASIVGQLSGITWIDTHSWLMNNGYRLVDGLHYDSNTYINIFNLIVGSL